MKRFDRFVYHYHLCRQYSGVFSSLRLAWYFSKASLPKEDSMTVTVTPNPTLSNEALGRIGEGVLAQVEGGVVHVAPGTPGAVPVAPATAPVAPPAPAAPSVTVNVPAAKP